MTLFKRLLKKDVLKSEELFEKINEIAVGYTTLQIIMAMGIVTIHITLKEKNKKKRIRTDKIGKMIVEYAGITWLLGYPRKFK